MRKNLLILMLALLAIPFAARAEELTVAEGTTTNERIPLYGYYWDTGFKNTMVYPATDLEDMAGCQINKITFYANANITALTGGSMKVSLGEVSATTPTGHFSSGMTEVFNGIPSANGALCVITFDTPFEYNGGNLAIECYLTSKGTNCPRTYFYGADNENASYFTYGASLANGNQTTNFLPKATFDYDSAVQEEYSAKITPEEAAFGKVALGSSKTIEVKVKNNGQNGFNYSLTGLSAPFSTTAATSGELASGETLTVPVTFAPSAVGDYSGTLSIDCGNAGTTEIPLTGLSALELTVSDGTFTSYSLPLYNPGYYTSQKNQMIYPASMLEDLVGMKIKGLTFYNNGCVYNGTYNVSLGTTTQTAYENYNSPITGLTTVVTNHTAVANGTFDITFDEPFDYNGENLVVEIEVTDRGTENSYASTSWYGTQQEANTGFYAYVASFGNSGGVSKFLPKMTVAYEEGEVVAYEAKVTPEACDFGSVATGTVNEIEVKVRNTGENAFTPAVSVSGDGFSVNYTATEVSHLGNVSFPVVFTPTKAGNFSGTLTVNCGEAGTFEIPLSGVATNILTVADGTAKNAMLPVYGNWYDADQTNQMLYPASMLTGLEGKRIKTLTFYASANTTFFSGGNITISLGNTEQETFTTAARVVPTDLTEIHNAAAPGGTMSEWTITIPEDVVFIYNGGSLLVDVVTTAGTYKDLSFFGESGHTNASWYSYNNTKALQSFLPKMSIGFDDLSGVVMVDPKQWDATAYVGDEPVTQDFTVTNAMGSDITLALTGLDGTPFSVSCESATVADGAEATVTVTYTPTAEAGEHSATLTIFDDVTVALTGETLAHVISGTVTPSELTFSCYEEQTATADITIENTGNTAFTPVFSDIEAPFSIADAEEIAPGETKTFAVTYAPAALGEHTGLLTVTIGSQEGIAVGLTGNCTEAPLEITVADATNVSTNLPITGNYFDTEGTYGQTIYSAEMLSNLAGKDITKVKYYAAQTVLNATKIAGTVLEIYMMETDENEIPRPNYSYQPLSFEGAAIGEYTIVGGETELEFTLSTPFNYSGNKNLAIQVVVKTISPQSGSNYQNISWYGQDQVDFVSYYYYDTSGSGKNFIPKTTFSYNKSEPQPEATTLAEILETNPVGTEVTVSNDLAIAEIVVDQNLVFVSDGEDNWIELQVSDDVLNFIATTPTLAGSSVKGQFVYDGFNPSIVVEEIPAAAQEQLTVEPAVYPVNLDFAPKPCEVFFVTGYYHGAGGTDNMPNLREWSGNGGQMGVLLDLDLSWARGSMEEGKHYKIRGTALLKEAWEAPSANGIRPRMATDDPMALRNYTIMATAIPSATTGIETIAGGEVKSVRYYNAQGLESAVPFQGINIVVMEMNDGTKKTVKVVK